MIRRFDRTLLISTLVLICVLLWSVAFAAVRGWL